MWKGATHIMDVFMSLKFILCTVCHIIMGNMNMHMIRVEGRYNPEDRQWNGEGLIRG